MVYEVTAFDPPRRVELRDTGSTVNALDDIRFKATDRETHIRYTADLRLRGVLRLAEPFVRSRFVETGRRAMEGMRTALERMG